MDDNTQKKMTKAHCNTCGGERNHDIVFSHTKIEVIISKEEELKGWWEIHEDYEVLSCCGCETICFRKAPQRHLYAGGENVFDWEKPVYFPPATLRKMPKWLTKFAGLKNTDPGGFVADYMTEIYTALQNGCYALAAMGVRALLEQVVIEKAGDHGTFNKNFDRFEKEGFITPSQRKIIDNTLELGHAAIHRNFWPSNGEISTALEITESVIANIYHYEEAAAKLTTRVPERKRRADRSKGDA